MGRYEQLGVTFGQLDKSLNNKDEQAVNRGREKDDKSTHIFSN